MNRKTFVIIMTLLAVMLVSMLAAVWFFVFAPRMAVPEEDFISDAIREEEVEHIDTDSGKLSWDAPGIEVGTLTYTVTRASVATDLGGISQGKVRENSVICLYDASGVPSYYFYPDCMQENGALVSGASLVLLDIRVESEDAVNFITNPTTGIQNRRYADNPFLFRADEIGYLIDTGENADDGYIYYDAVFFSEMGVHSEHTMAYEIQPGEVRNFRIGFLLGNRQDGSPMDHSDLVLSTLWNDPEEQYFDLNLAG